MLITKLSPAEVALRAKQIYADKLKSILEPKYMGKFIIIDIESEEFEIDDNGDEASLRAFLKKPNGIRYGMRVGHDYWGSIGIGGANQGR